MSAKNNDPKGRFRSKTIGYRCSPEEKEEINMRWKLCGYASKQDYSLDCVLHSKVIAKGNPMMLVNFRKELGTIISELKRIDEASELDEELFVPINRMLEILEAFEAEAQKGKKKKDKFLERRQYRHV